MSKKKDIPEEENQEGSNAAVNPAGDTETPEFEMQTDLTEALRTELAAEKDRYLRLAAEYDNYRKRSQKEREALFSDVKADTITKILPIYDNISRALAIPCADEAFYKGIEMIMVQVADAFDKLGLKRIPTVGEIFDPGKHNAVVHVEDDTLGESVIIEEFQAGFTIGEKVIRFAMVKVAN